MALLLAAVALPAGGAEAPTSRPAMEDMPIRRSAPAGSPAERAGADAASSLWRMMAALGAVIGLIFALRWLSQRVMGLGDTGASGTVKILARAAVSPRQQMLLVHVGRRLLLVGNSGASLNTLAQITDPDEVAAILGQIRQRHPAAAGGAFETALRGASAEYASDDAEPAEPSGQTADAARNDAATTSRVREDLAGLIEKVRTLGGLFRKVS